MDILQISHYLDQLLDIDAIPDAKSAVNGLQVENRGEIKKIGLAVDLCQATIDRAAASGCNMLFVHHGMFWDGLRPVRGLLYEKLSTMMTANLGLYSAHLPLDMHPVLGNNRALADLAGVERLEAFGEYNGIKIGLKGQILKTSAAEFGEMFEEKLGSPVRVIGEGEIKTVGLVTGGAGSILHQAVAEGLDCYVTGEAENQFFHAAIEGECVLILGGHYATETGGVKAVGKHLQEQFGVETEFIDYPTGL